MSNLTPIALAKTTEDILDLNSRIDSAIKSSFSTENDLKTVLKSVFDKDQYNFITNYLTINNSNKEKNDSEKLSDLKNIFSSLPVVLITLAFKPSVTFIDFLSEWIRENIKNDAVLDITLDPNIVGGILIIKDGRIIDLSLQKKLHNYLETI